MTNGPKEQLGAGEGANSSEEFEPWRTQQQNSAAHTAYGASVPISSATDLYSMNTAGMLRFKAVGCDLHTCVFGQWIYFK